MFAYLAGGCYNAIENKTATLTFNKASVSKPAQDSTSFVYNGNEQTYQLAENSLYTISGNKQTNAGNYNVIISLKDKNNYQWNDETIADLSYCFNIAKATYDMSAVVFGHIRIYSTIFYFILFLSTK